MSEMPKAKTQSVKRYNFIPEDDSYHETAEMRQDKDGEWVRWEDVQELLQRQEDRYAEEMLLLDARLQRLLAKENVVSNANMEFEI